MPAWLLWQRIRRLATRKHEEQDAEHKKWVIEQLNLARAVTFALEANTEIPPTRQEAQAKKPDWGKIEQARKQVISRRERHFEGISSAYHYEEYMGLPHSFPPPEPERLKTSSEIRDADAVTASIKSRLQTLIAASSGDANIADIRIPPPTAQEVP